jgi:hypothetical protein
MAIMSKAFIRQTTKWPPVFITVYPLGEQAGQEIKLWAHESATTCWGTINKSWM